MLPLAAEGWPARSPRVGRLTPTVTSGLEKWPSVPGVKLGAHRIPPTDPLPPFSVLQEPD